MPGKTPKSNGDKPLENGVRSNGDVEMTDGGKTKGKKGAKDADEEMTVVVPPAKSSKQSSKRPEDAEEDVAMDEDEKANESEVKIDPVVQTVAGECLNRNATSKGCYVWQICRRMHQHLHFSI